MLLKRVIMLVTSLVVGVGLTYVIVLLLDTTVAEYWRGPEQPVPFPYFILTSIFIGLAVAIWLDKFMKTGFISENSE